MFLRSGKIVNQYDYNSEQNTSTYTRQDILLAATNLIHFGLLFCGNKSSQQMDAIKIALFCTGVFQRYQSYKIAFSNSPVIKLLGISLIDSVTYRGSNPFIHGLFLSKSLPLRYCSIKNISCRAFFSIKKIQQKPKDALIGTGINLFNLVSEIVLSASLLPNFLGCAGTNKNWKSEEFKTLFYDSYSYGALSYKEKLIHPDLNPQNFEDAIQMLRKPSEPNCWLDIAPPSGQIYKFCKCIQDNVTCSTLSKTVRALQKTFHADKNKGDPLADLISSNINTAQTTIKEMLNC